jgi:uncharacterized protein (TIGR00297 family)
MFALPDTLDLMGWSIPTLALQIPLGTALALAIGLISLRVRFLSPGGVIALGFIGFATFGLGGIAWAIPIFAFFLPSSLITRLGKARKQRLSQLHAKGGRRDAGQVLANGGMAGVLALLWFMWNNPVFYFAYVASLGAAAADTWSAELGVLSPEHPRLITTWRVVDAGISGGVTALGTLGGLLGASVVFVSALPFASILGSWQAYLLILGCALGGNIVDSLLGATLQEKRRCTVCGGATERKEHCGCGTEWVGGIPGFGNDWVNLLCTAVGGSLGMLAYGWLANLTP